MNKPGKPARSARPLADVTTTLLAESFRRQGFASSELVLRWAAIVGPDVADHAEPLKLRENGVAGPGEREDDASLLELVGELGDRLAARIVDVVDRIGERERDIARPAAHALATVLAYDDIEGMPLRAAPNSGYARIERGGTKIIADIGPAPIASVSTAALMPLTPW